MRSVPPAAGLPGGGEPACTVTHTRPAATATPSGLPPTGIVSHAVGPRVDARHACRHGCRPPRRRPSPTAIPRGPAPRGSSPWSRRWRGRCASPCRRACWRPIPRRRRPRSPLAPLPDRDGPVTTPPASMRETVLSASSATHVAPAPTAIAGRLVADRDRRLHAARTRVEPGNRRVAGRRPHRATRDRDRAGAAATRAPRRRSHARPCAPRRRRPGSIRMAVARA